MNNSTFNTSEWELIFVDVKITHDLSQGGYSILNYGRQAAVTV